MAHFHPDPLRARLHDVEEEIRGRVVEVCKFPPPEDCDTGAMIRFEEELSIVTSAAKEAVSLRRRLRVEDEHGSDTPPHRRDRMAEGDSQSPSERSA